MTPCKKGCHNWMTGIPSLTKTHLCCTFQPEFGCCALQTLVKICVFISFLQNFAANVFFYLRFLAFKHKKHQKCIFRGLFWPAFGMSTSQMLGGNIQHTCLYWPPLARGIVFKKYRNFALFGQTYGENYEAFFKFT